MNSVDIFKKLSKVIEESLKGPNQSKILKESDQSHQMQLDEDLGNLEKIRPELRSAMMQRLWRASPGGANKSGEKLKKGLGQGSEVLDIKPTSAGAAWKAFAEDNPKIKGMVLVVDDNQILSMGKSSGGRYGMEKEFGFVLDMEAYQNMETNQERFQKLRDKHYLMNDFDGKEGLAISAAKEVINYVYQAAKKSGGNISALLITVDEAAAAKQKERQAARAGMDELEGLDPKSEKYRRIARVSLKARLDKFKSERAEEYDSFGDFIQAAIDKGYLEKVKIAGAIYNLDRDNINLSRLMGQDSWGQKATIEYVISNTDPKTKEIEDKIYNAYNAKDKELAKELKDTLPPRRVEFELGLEGGKIVPTGNFKVTQKY